MVFYGHVQQVDSGQAPILQGLATTYQNVESQIINSQQRAFFAESKLKNSRHRKKLSAQKSLSSVFFSSRQNFFKKSFFTSNFFYPKPTLI
jgi:hypothetical protein